MHSALNLLVAAGLKPWRRAAVGSEVPYFQPLPIPLGSGPQEKYLPPPLSSTSDEVGIFQFLLRTPHGRCDASTRPGQMRTIQQATCNQGGMGISLNMALLKLESRPS
eukprot:CAMPEP_0182946592 /NCGR_PEP_ID=MMETSP0105_2-20130417/57283_1 /TAXON_ID=81532 ORGANISM="Acanthoeca-like sp., Strain 10tr" /NCGR_SAMPLE_ID=MMETSP0105_2 /ASSEMBLY_ACC=CAM_ASM_000205 /LENGTH=107 /DNA_ID=CAMNT_0025086729 /DNA_START=294 /DNA_END=614 /DNA_ORIENTATION=+